MVTLASVRFDVPRETNVTDSSLRNVVIKMNDVGAIEFNYTLFLNRELAFEANSGSFQVR